MVFLKKTVLSTKEVKNNILWCKLQGSDLIIVLLTASII